MKSVYFVVLLLFAASCDNSYYENGIKFYKNPITISGQQYRKVNVNNKVWIIDPMRVEFQNAACYENKPDICNKIGKLYDFDTATQMAEELQGWRLPTREELHSLLGLGVSQLRQLFPNQGGHYDPAKQKFSDLGRGASFWSSTSLDETEAFYLHLARSCKSAAILPRDKKYKLSVVLVKE